MTKSIALVLLAALSIYSTVSCSAEADVPVYQVELINTYKHDSQAFTQGLVFHEGMLYEGTGRNGQSSIRRVDINSGEILQRQNLGSRYFGEGITIFDGRIFQLTWRSHLGFVYDLESFKQVQTFFIPGEGWGITHNDELLIMSDGTSTIRFLDPLTLQTIKQLQVSEAGVPLDRLNELEYIDGEIWANVWYTNFIVRIDPDTGEVNSKLDLSQLNQQQNTDDVLNGIAWDAASGRVFVTGKLWPELYEIQVQE